MGTVRLFLGVVSGHGWHAHQMDVHNTFLRVDLEEEVYMKFPPGFHYVDARKVCRLHKLIYGLRQAPSCWLAKLNTALKDYGFEQDLYDYSLFTFERNGIHLNILIYVDDMIIPWSSLAEITEFK